MNSAMTASNARNTAVASLDLARSQQRKEGGMFANPDGPLGLD